MVRPLAIARRFEPSHRQTVSLSRPRARARVSIVKRPGSDESIMFPLETFPVEAAGTTVLIVSLLITAAWVYFLFR